MKRLLIIGSTCVDVILRIDHLPTSGEDMHPVQRFAMGGCAYNAAQVPKAYDVDLCFVTPIGRKGMFSDFVRSHLREDGFRGPVDVPGENGCCYCLVEKNGERTFLSVHGVEYSFHEDYMSSVAGECFDYTYICGLEVEEPSGEALVHWLEMHSKTSGTVVYAPGPRGLLVDPARTARILRLRPILHLNEQEAVELADTLQRSADAAASAQGTCTFDEKDAAPTTGTSMQALCTFTDADAAVVRAARALQARTQNLLIVTRGANGVLWLSEDGRMHTLPAETAKVVDTIGAGDSHCGAVLTGLALGWCEEDTMAFANRIAAEVVSQESGAYTKRTKG